MLPAEELCRGGEDCVDHSAGGPQVDVEHDEVSGAHLACRVELACRVKLVTRAAARVTVPACAAA